MSCADGSAIVELPSKSAAEVAAVVFRVWHDFLANKPKRGSAYSVGAKVRLPRSQATGFQYECTTAGVTGQTEPRWPKTLNATATDGSVVWTAKAVAADSLRTTISSSQFLADVGVTLGAESNDDLDYTVLVSGGTSGESYLIKHRITCANGEVEEAVGRLPVED
jgi:hypothetical protein